MKLSEVMARADALRLNTVSEEQKARWVWELEDNLGNRNGRPHRMEEENENFGYGEATALPS